MQNRSSVHLAKVESKIHFIRGQKVILDSDLAKLYGVTTKALNQAVKRNPNRFPSEFKFRLSMAEAQQFLLSRSQIVTLKRGQNVKYLPHAFTEHGALMAANVLNSSRAVAMSVYIILAFIRLREEFAANAILEKRLAVIEKNLLSHDVTLRDVIAKIRPLLLPPPEPPKRRIGFHENKI